MCAKCTALVQQTLAAAAVAAALVLAYKPFLFVRLIDNDDVTLMNVIVVFHFSIYLFCITFALYFYKKFYNESYEIEFYLFYSTDSTGCSIISTVGIIIPYLLEATII